MSTTEKAVLHRNNAPKEGIRLCGVKAGTFAILIACLLLTAILNVPVFKNWWVQWNAKESYYSHGILIPFIVGMLIWLNRRNLAEIELKPSVSAYWLLVPCLAMVVFMIWVPSLSIAGLLFPLYLFAMVAVVFGWRMAWAAGFPISYLYFMAPLPTFILTAMSFRIRMLSTIGATHMLRMLAIHTTRVGTEIMLANGVTVAVEAPCSGFRFLISLFALAVLAAYLVEGSLWRKGLLVGLMLPLSILLNGFRIMMVALVGNYWGTEAMMTFHDDFAGLIMILMGIALLYVLARLLKCQRFNSRLSF